jgi:hypothetical protein
MAWRCLKASSIREIMESAALPPAFGRAGVVDHFLLRGAEQRMIWDKDDTPQSCPRPAKGPTHSKAWTKIVATVTVAPYLYFNSLERS